MATTRTQLQADPAERQAQPAAQAVEALDATAVATQMPALARAIQPGVGGPTAATVLAMQRHGGNAAVAQLLQRKEGDAAPDVQPGSVPNAQPTAAPNQPAGGAKSKNLILDAIYHNVPGESRTVKARAATDKDALWFDPITTHSNAPSVAESTKSMAILTGGQQRVDSMNAPVTDTPTPVGRGSITTELKYTKAKNDSISVSVSGVKGYGPAAKAKARAQAFVRDKINKFGDVEDIQAQAEADLKNDYPDAKVSIAIVPQKVEDVGRTTVYYKLKGDAELLLDIQVVPDGEKQVTSGGSQTKGGSTDDEKSSKDSKSTDKTTTDNTSKDSTKSTTTSTEEEESAYNSSVAHTIDDHVSKLTETHKTVTEDLAKKVVTDSEYHEKYKAHSKQETTKTDDYKSTVEKGKRKNENWAAKLQKVTGIAKKILDAPLSILGKAGKLLRKLNEYSWVVDIVDEGLGIFAESGDVDFTDTKVDSTSKTTDEKNSDATKDVTRNDTQTTTQTVKTALEQSVKEDWDRHLKELTTTSAEYKRKVKKDSSSQTDTTHDDHGQTQNDKQSHEEAEKHRAAQNQSVTTNFEVRSNWTYSVPAVRASVVNGTIEVAAAAFGPDPDEKAQAAPAQTPTPTPAPTPNP